MRLSVLLNTHVLVLISMRLAGSSMLHDQIQAVVVVDRYLAGDLYCFTHVMFLTHRQFSFLLRRAS